MTTDFDAKALTDKTFQLLDLVYGYNPDSDDDKTAVGNLLDELAPDPHRAVGLCCVIVKATATVLRAKWQKTGAVEDGDLLGLARTTGSRPSPAVWRAGQMLTAEWNGDHDDVADHAIAANHADDMEALMAQLLLQWAAIARLDIEVHA